ncbi:ribulose 1,5-bisphosphate carboxylase large subunit [Cyclonatronum proteinivorum]|uniref:Ribulose 1,5-bisphosphate carboxylase large subunit n=1 Tax=Cyclonatronum proteinivorum TaxID=1457365 RepID=A0A345UIZ1_9BACT|nr:RuBisCO large subunit C-terminal-like domain-containing protein [Cyclonatronum proteinivorum]AXJ00443.1 ribulose 1,5-bisphosphate carboxylase large subunit [Cyclonatronum proteinivorum]
MIISENRFTVHYLIQAVSKSEAALFCRRIAYEQSVELPDDVLSDEIRGHIVGQLISLTAAERENRWQASISYALDSLGDEVSQFLNVLFGNMSLFPGAQVVGCEWDEIPDEILPGPKAGLDGVREKFGITRRRALSCSALKPIGLETRELAHFCYSFALGGVDIIKDDHGLANQPTSPFADRLAACTDAVKRAADKTGHLAAYFPNITADGSETLRRYEQAYEAGAGGVLLMPHLCGPSTMTELAKSGIPLPIMAHPAFSGAYVMSDTQGFTPEFLYGTLWRKLGADFVIYPNAGGRFSFSEAACHAINENCRRPLGGIAASIPTPGGGVQRDTLTSLLEAYGPDTCFLIGGSLYQHPRGIEFASRELTELLNQ